MNENTFRVLQIDHVELFVPDQYEAAQWYEKVFGLKILPEFEHWAATGPLMISSDGGSTMLALFTGTPTGADAGFRRVAFRVDAAGFLAFADRLTELDLTSMGGGRLTPDDVVDHEPSWSYYFTDPWGYPFEITTYDYDSVKTQLARKGAI
jgi:catechol 2,3-dioxygenase-like lactoylglutathione lyase family enzyme